MQEERSGILTLALPIHAAAMRARSFPPPLLPIVQGEIAVVDSQMARPTPATFSPPQNSSPEVAYQEELHKGVRTATIEARMAICFNKQNMAEWHMEKKEGWVRASEEVQRVARDVRDVDLAQETPQTPEATAAEGQLGIAGDQPLRTTWCITS